MDPHFAKVGGDFGAGGESGGFAHAVGEEGAGEERGRHEVAGEVLECEVLLAGRLGGGGPALAGDKVGIVLHGLGPVGEKDLVEGVGVEDSAARGGALNPARGGARGGGFRARARALGVVSRGGEGGEEGVAPAGDFRLGVEAWGKGASFGGEGAEPEAEGVAEGGAPGGAGGLFADGAREAKRASRRPGQACRAGARSARASASGMPPRRCASRSWRTSAERGAT